MYFLNYNFWLHLISFLEDGSTTCCCDNTTDCCWDKCYKTTGIDADLNCKKGVKARNDFLDVYWAEVENTNYSILIGKRIKITIGKFYN